MRIILLFITFLFLHMGIGFSQYNTNQNKFWAFGSGAGLDWTTGSPVSIGTSIATSEGCAAVASTTGSLLFYTDGRTVYNSTGAVMTGGAAIVSFGTSSSTQGTAIAPVISNPNQYYIFSVEDYGSTGRFAYSVVDMTLSGGLGSVITAGTALGTGMAEKMCVVAGNSCDLWVLVHRKDSAVILAYHIDATGLSTIPVVSHVGFFSGSNSYCVGVMKASPNRQKLVAQCYSLGFGEGTELYDFNPSTGVASNCVRLDSTHNCYGGEFSPDNSKLYVQEAPGGISQYDLSLSTAAAVRASKTNINSTGTYTDLKIGYDGKVYMNALSGFGSGYLDCITSPNLAGTACNYVAHTVNLAPHAGQFGLPNVYIALVGGGDTSYTRHDTTACIPATGITLSAHGTGTSYLWADGTTTSTRVVTAPGTYTVAIDSGCHVTLDTIVLSRIPLVTTTTHHDTLICAFTGAITIHGLPGYSTYTWYDGAGGYTHIAPASGAYWVRVNDTCGNIFVDTTNVLYLAPDTTVGVTHYDSLCVTVGSLTLTATPGYTSYRWNTGALGSSIGVTSTGTYWVWKKINCSIVVDTYHVYFIPVPIDNIGADTAFCIGGSIVLSSTQPSGTSYLWSTGSTADSIHVATTGTYWLRLDNGCVITDSIHVLVSPFPIVDLGPDTANCLGSSVELSSSVTYTLPTYQWSNGSTAPTTTATSTGTYWLQVTQAGCAAADTINVTILFDSVRLLNRDTAICLGQVVQVVMYANPSATFQWIPTAGIALSTSRNPLIIPDTTAMYHVNIYLAGCPVKTDSFLIDVQPNPNVFIGGNRFICAYDSIHINASVLPAWYGGYSYSWSPATSLDNTNTSTVVFTAGISAMYHLTVTTPAGCIGKDSAQLTVNPGDFAVLTKDTSVCPHDSFQLNVSGGASYKWYPGYYLDDSTSAAPWIKAVATQTYRLIATSSAGCKDTGWVKVTVWPAGVILLDDSVTVYPGGSYQLSPVSNCLSFTWFPPAGLSNTGISNPVASPDVSTMYRVFGVTDKGCKAEDSITVNISAESILATPNAFTPGTGINNKFYVIKNGEANLNYFRIYNRWGNMVFETKNISDGWDGTYKGQPQPFGVYIYEIQATTSNGKLFTKQGNLTLLR